MVRPVRVVSIQKRATTDTVSLTGTVQAETEINQSFRIDGRLIERAVNVGDAVRPGQLIARLDSHERGDQRAVGAARRSTRRAPSWSRRATTSGACRTWSTRTPFLVRHSSSPRLFMKTAESRVETAQAQVTLAENRLSYTRLISDVGGVVTAQGAEVGEVVGAGRMIVQVARDGGRDAVFDVPARVKDNAPPNARDFRRAHERPAISAIGTRARSLAAGRPGDRDVPRPRRA